MSTGDGCRLNDFLRNTLPMYEYDEEKEEGRKKRERKVDE